MDITILVEPEYQNTYWCVETLRGIKEQAYYRKMRVILLEEKDYESLEAQLKRQVIVMVGTSITWFDCLVPRLSRKGISCLLVSGTQGIAAADNVSNILMDYRRNMRILLSYLKSIGSKKIAFFGANPNSYADKIKISSFPYKQDIYYNLGTVITCTNQFWNKIAHYDSVICANDVVAIYLLYFLQTKGIKIPEELCLVSFGDLFISNLISPSITSITLDFHILGQQAVNLYSFLVRNPQLTVNAFVNCNLKIRKTTREQYIPDNIPAILQFEKATDINFYDDTPVLDILSLEKLIVSSDPLDLAILLDLLHNNKLDDIAERQNLSISSLRYRIKKMSACFPDLSKNSMLQTLLKYMKEDSLQKAISLKQK